MRALNSIYNAAIANREVFENNRTIKIIRNLPHPKTKNEHAHSPGWQAYIHAHCSMLTHIVYHRKTLYTGTTYAFIHRC